MKTLTNIPEPCTPSERGQNWPLVLFLFRYLPTYLRCPRIVEYIIAAASWFAVFLYQIVREPPFYMDCLFFIWVMATLARMFVSQEAMVIVCALGLTVALLVLKPLGWVMGSEWKGRSLIRNALVGRQ